jgi:hypothetical protein
LPPQAAGLGVDEHPLDDCHGAQLQPIASDRGRADDGAGRDGSGPDPLLFRDLRRDHESSIILITHDLGVVSEIAEQVMVMYSGKVVERGEKKRTAIQLIISSRLALLLSRDLPPVRSNCCSTAPTTAKL